MTTVAIAVIAVFCGVLTIATLGLYRSLADVRLYLAGNRSEKGILLASGLELPVGANVLAIDDAHRGLLVFLRSSCSICKDLAAEISEQREPSLPITLAIDGPPSTMGLSAEVPVLDPDLANELYELLRITDTPLALLLENQVVQGSAMGEGAASIELLRHLWDSVVGETTTTA